ncbi:MAG: glycosyltransferase [Methyloprofundus sp.]|nr:glycosyltransferase [Methyloprofundus sp.]
MKKISFLTTIFPMELGYLKEMLDSLVIQSFTAFDLIVVNDGLSEFTALKKNYKNELNIIELKGIPNPAQNREIGINYCIEKGYDFLIFGDSDDTFSSNRIQVSVEKLQQSDIVVNDLTLFNTNGVLEDHYLSNRVKNNEQIEFDFIKNKNLFGLSNTAIRLQGMSPIKMPPELVAVDWYLFSALLLKNKEAVFTNQAVTHYRQYDGNLVGLKHLNKESFLCGLRVKQQHYQALKQITEKVDNEYQQYCNSDIAFKEKTELAYPLWWELI